MPLSRKRSFMDDCKHFRIAAEPRKYRQAGVGGVCPIWSAQEQNKEFNTKRTTDSSYDGMIPKCEKPSNISDSMVERTVKNVTDTYAKCERRGRICAFSLVSPYIFLRRRYPILVYCICLQGRRYPLASPMPLAHLGARPIGRIWRIVCIIKTCEHALWHPKEHVDSKRTISRPFDASPKCFHEHGFASFGHSMIFSKRVFFMTRLLSHNSASLRRCVAGSIEICRWCMMNMIRQAI